MSHPWAEYEAGRDFLRKAHPDWRRGQCCFAALEGVDPELAKQIRAKPLDPYYLDVRIPAFEHAIRSHWKKAS
jgi:hypothetical protein